MVLLAGLAPQSSTADLGRSLPIGALLELLSERCSELVESRAALAAEVQRLRREAGEAEAAAALAVEAAAKEELEALKHRLVLQERPSLVFENAALDDEDVGITFGDGGSGELAGDAGPAEEEKPHLAAVLSLSASAPSTVALKKGKIVKVLSFTSDAGDRLELSGGEEQEEDQEEGGGRRTSLISGRSSFLSTRQSFANRQSLASVASGRTSIVSDSRMPSLLSEATTDSDEAGAVTYSRRSMIDTSASLAPPILNSCWAQGQRPSRASVVWDQTMSLTETAGSVGIGPGTTAGRRSVYEEPLKTSSCSVIVMAPSGGLRICWDLLSSCVLIWEMVVLPLQAFEAEGEATISLPAIELAETIFWTLDILLSFITGFQVGGCLEMRPFEIMKRYLRTWFAIDMSIVTVDWTIIAMSAMNSAEVLDAVRMSKALRIIRILRLLRLVRFVKFKFRTNSLQSSVRSETAVILVGMVKLGMGLALLNHWVACAWYALGTMKDEVKTTWVRELTERRPQSSSAFFFYGTSLHWSLTQFTPASMEIVPTNSIERVFNIVVIVIAVLSFSSLLGSITQALNKLRDITSSTAQEDSLIRLYLQQNSVSLDLGNRLLSYVNLMRSGKSRDRVHFQDISVFQEMPDHLKCALEIQVYTPILTRHPFFHAYYHLDQDAIFLVCHSGISETMVSPSKELFRRGQECSRMHFVVSGTLIYHIASGPRKIRVRVGNCVGEAGLWLKWTHRGTLVAASRGTMAEMVSVDAREFCKVFTENPYTFPLLQKYASEYEDEILGRLASDEHDFTGDFCLGFDDSVQLAKRHFNEAIKIISRSSMTRLSRGSRGISVARGSNFSTNEHEGGLKGFLTRMLTTKEGSSAAL